jgi:hypothetical protein
MTAALIHWVHASIVLGGFALPSYTITGDTTRTGRTSEWRNQNSLNYPASSARILEETARHAPRNINSLATVSK